MSTCIDINADVMPERKDSFKQRFKDYVKENGIAGAYYLAGRTLDTIVTSYSAHKYGADIEINPIQRYIMDSLGIDEGLALSSAAEISIFLPLSFNKKKIIDIKTKNFLYIMGTAHFIGAATHLPNIILDYF